MLNYKVKIRTLKKLAILVLAIMVIISIIALLGEPKTPTEEPPMQERVAVDGLGKLSLGTTTPDRTVGRLIYMVNR